MIILIFIEYEIFHGNYSHVTKHSAYAGTLFSITPKTFKKSAVNSFLYIARTSNGLGSLAKYKAYPIYDVC